MAEVPIPAASLERLRATYAQFEQLCAVVSEAMGMAPGSIRSVSLPTGVFVTEDAQAAAPEAAHEHANGVAV